jgi:hypothetical protein
MHFLQFGFETIPSRSIVEKITRDYRELLRYHRKDSHKPVGEQGKYETNYGKKVNVKKVQQHTKNLHHFPFLPLFSLFYPYFPFFTLIFPFLPLFSLFYPYFPFFTRNLQQI